MKKLLLTFSVLLAGCAVVEITPSNENCIETKQFEVFQALEDGALANECVFDWDSLSSKCSPFNQTVFILNQRGVSYYDGMKIEAPSGKCAVRDGVYKYISKDDRSRTVPAIRFEYKNEPQSEEEFMGRMAETRLDIYDSCLTELAEEAKKNKAKTIKKCQCVADTITDKVINITTADNSIQDQQGLTAENFAKDFMADVEKKCGKLPEHIKN